MIFNADEIPGRTIKLSNGLAYRWFSGTDYLGMAHNFDFKEFLDKGIQQYGMHYGSSRNSSLRIDIYDEVESILADYTSSPSSLVVSSGMLAGQLLHKEIENIVQKHTKSHLKINYHYAPNIHPALWGNQYQTNNANWYDWAVKTVEQIDTIPNEIHIILSDTIGSPKVAYFDFSIFKNLPASENIWLIVDDSHGIGVLGNLGVGSYQTIRKQFRSNLIVVASLNKALGIPAGAIFSEIRVTDMIQQSPFFSGASPALPSYMYVLRQMIKQNIYQKQYHLLGKNLEQFNSSLIASNCFNGISNYPVYNCNSNSLFHYLENKRILVSKFAYPRPTDLPITRLAFNSCHTAQDIEALIDACLQFQKQDIA